MKQAGSCTAPVGARGRGLCATAMGQADSCKAPAGAGGLLDLAVAAAGILFCSNTAHLKPLLPSPVVANSDIPRRRVPECAEAVGALARNVILRAPDKATARSAAVEGAVALARLLDVADQQRFVGFVARLSRTAKV